MCILPMLHCTRLLLQLLLIYCYYSYCLCVYIRVSVFVTMCFLFVDLNQYTVESTPMSPTRFISPNIFQHKACFTFKYYSNKYNTGRLSVFIKVASSNKSQVLPFWSEKVKKRKWQTIKILLHHENGFNQVSRLFLS